MKSAPLVSIAIVAFNPRFFSAALHSALDQTYANLEIVVCDDCRTDEIQRLVDEARSVYPAANLRYVRNPRRLGFQQNILRCFEEATGDYIKFLCDDDRLVADCVARQARVLDTQEDVLLVVSKHHFFDADNYVLPIRMENVGLTQFDALFKGQDLLANFEKAPRNILGGFSCALMRRADIEALLPALTQAEGGFVAVLDFALFVCLLRRGNLVELSALGSFERLYPERLSHRPETVSAAIVEWGWLEQMLAQRSGDQAPAQGWVRYLALDEVAGPEPHAWEEINLYALMAGRQGIIQTQVGTDTESYADLYAQWLQCRRFSPAQQQLLSRQMNQWAKRPQIMLLVIDAEADHSAVDLTLDSIAAQDYPAQVLLLSSGQRAVDSRARQVALRGDWPAQLNELLPGQDGADWIYLLRAGDRLRDTALQLLAERIACTQGVACIYSDEGALVDEKSLEPIFKPDFNLDLLRAYPYVGRTLAFDRQAVLSLGGFDARLGELAPHDLIWRLVESQGPQVIEHIAEVQVESSLSFAQWLSLPQVVEQNPCLLGVHLRRIGVEHRLHEGDGLQLIPRIEYLHASRPLVSILIGVSDDLPALERCINSLISHTAYSRYEIVIVDNASANPEIRHWLQAMAGLGSDTLRIFLREYSSNEAQLMNFAAQQARGDYLLLFSPYCILRDADWLDELLNHGQRPEVGIVGPRTLNLQGNVIDAGLILGLGGLAGRAFVNEPVTSGGYMQRMQVVQDWSAVSGHCLLVRAQVFADAGGFDESVETQGINSLELCLRVGKDGYLVVSTPHAVVVLAPSQEPRRQEGWEQRLEQEQEAFYKRWLPKVARDPAYNRNLNLQGSSFGLMPGARSGWNPLCGRPVPSILGLALNNSAIGHYRISQPLIELQAAQRIVGSVSYDMPSIIDVERLQPDVIVFQGRYNTSKFGDIAQVRHYSNARRIYELDDYVAHIPERNEHARNMPDNIEDLLRRGIAQCDRVVVSTLALANALDDMHQDIRVVPNMLAPHLWNSIRSQRRTSLKPRIGWGGGTSHRGDLELIADVIKELANEVEWVFFGMCPEMLKPYVHEYHPGVSLAHYPAKLASLNLDLALAPLEFHVFNDCKSNLRLLEYGACGYPVICSDTEAYRGHLPCTRVLGNSAHEWLQAIRMHLADPQASYRMGDELREVVLRDFMLRGDNLQYWADGWLAD
ncbi:glycosyltransferase [Pseudomonas chlororaphis subsp. aurantiaca]|uniref:glycosyltransferase n=1 Tax=Pseudomonas chlororaphis TaxID=587753 RepID=UPI0027DC920C|nr:glycosyltransferase [Pseudomonas chlororaphis]WMJ01560.1 glycosyltransferase [Pseudomonas chlororaphis subsp. aurantiaca]